MRDARRFGQWLAGYNLQSRAEKAAGLKRPVPVRVRRSAPSQRYLNGGNALDGQEAINLIGLPPVGRAQEGQIDYVARVILELDERLVERGLGYGLGLSQVDGELPRRRCRRTSRRFDAV